MRDRVPLRVLTCNVRELRDDRAALQRVLSSAAADVLCLQEAPTGPLGAHRLAGLAGDVGARTAAAGRAGAGTAVLVAAHVDVRAGWVRALPTPRWRAHRPVRRRGAAEAVVRVRAPGGWSMPVLVRSVHLGLDEGERARHAALLAPRAPAAGSCAPWTGAPVVVAGDLNEAPGGHAHRALCAGAVDAAEALGATFATFPARAPRHRIDVVLVDGRLGVVAVTTPEAAGATRASDHLAVVADLLVPVSTGP